MSMECGNVAKFRCLSLEGVTDKHLLFHGKDGESAGPDVVRTITLDSDAVRLPGPSSSSPWLAWRPLSPTLRTPAPAVDFVLYCKALTQEPLAGGSHMSTKLRNVPVTIRTRTTKGGRRRLRAAGQVPAVVYGRGMDNLLVTVDQSLFTRALPEAVWYSTPLQLEIAGGKGRAPSHTAMVADVQRDIVAQTILSADFHVVSMEEEVHAQVPVYQVGELSTAAKGGIIEHIAHELTVAARPGDIPGRIEVDISTLTIGDNVKVKDLTIPANVKLLHASDDVVLVIAAPAKVAEVAPLAEGEAAVVAETAEPEVIRPQEEQ